MKTRGALFLLILFFSPLPECVAVTAQAVYDPRERSGGEGFFDETLGEARRNALERTLCVLENMLRGDFTIRVSAGFRSFPSDSSTLVTLAAATPCHVVVVPQTGETGLGYPSALARAVFGQDRIRGLCDDYDIQVVFNDRADTFHYGRSASRGTVDFTTVALHEIFHGLGFLEYMEDDGSLLSDVVSGSSGQSQRITLTSVYDHMTYSEADGGRLVDLTDAQRRAAITSGDGLLWDGAAGRRAAAGKSAGVSDDGRPRLYAPSAYEPASSVSHLDLSILPDDLLEPFFNNNGDMTLALAMLEDMGWNVNAAADTRACDTGSTQLPPAPPPPPPTDTSSRPAQPPIPIPPPVPEPAPVPAPPDMPTPDTPTPGTGTSGTGGTGRETSGTGGSGGGCAIASKSGPVRPDIALGNLLLMLSAPALAGFAKRTKSEK